MAAVLEHFSPAVREWFDRTFGEPTPPRVEGWPPIARGETTLISAPTGSGKTSGVGVEIEIGGGHVFRFRNGKVFWSRIYADPADARTKFEALAA